jgi:hypothetical protein
MSVGAALMLIAAMSRAMVVVNCIVNGTGGFCLKVEVEDNMLMIL